MTDKVFGADFTNDTNPAGTYTVTVNNGTALRDVLLSDLHKAIDEQGLLDKLSTTQGVIVYYNGTNWVALSPGTSGQFLETLGSGANPLWANVAPALPKGYLWGLTLSNNATDATNDIDIAVGECRDSGNSADMALSSGLTKQLDAAWAVGTNAGGLDTGSIGNNTYHVWLIKRGDTGVVDVLFSLSASSPTMPTNYTFKRRIGSIVRTGAVIKPFVQDGDKFIWKAPVLDLAATNPGTSAVSRTLTLPIGIRVEAIISVLGFGAAAADNPSGVLITDLSQDDVAAGTSAWTQYGYSGAAAAHYVGSAMRVHTNTTAQVRSRVEISTANTGLRIYTHGWVDTRGRNG
jgi:hypothetical protein